MIEGLLGVIVGGAITIATVLVAERLRAKNTRVENATKYRIEVFEKRKAALLTILEQARQFQGDLYYWNLKPPKMNDIKARWDSMTSFAPHLAVLPKPVSNFISDWIEEICSIIGLGMTASSPDLDKELRHHLVECFVEITNGVSTVIATIDAEIMSMTPAEDFVFFEKNAKNFRYPARKGRDIGSDRNDKTN